jgi:ribokinase
MNSLMAANAPRICVVGSANVDLTFRTARLPRPGETVAGREMHVGFGGKGANQAVAAARLGASVSFVGRVGDDSFGTDYVKRLAEEKLDTTFVRPVAGCPTGSAAILVDDRAENCIVVAPGANARLTLDHIIEASPAIFGADVLLCQLEVPLETTLDAFRIANARGTVRTVLNPAPAMPLPDELVSLTDLMVLNETELEVLTGCRDPEAGIAELQQRGAKAIALTLGERGARLADGSRTASIPAFRVSAVDPTGAGDAFTAALAVGWARGQSLRHAASIAAAVAALTVTRLGTQTAFPTQAELSAFIASVGTT